LKNKEKLTWASFWKKTKEWAKKIIMLVVNPRFLLCFGIGWMITNGWAYIMLALGTWLGIPWMMAVGGGYLALLWIPFTPEKIITVAIALVLLKLLFPNDEKTLGLLHELYEKAKGKKEELKEKHESKKEENKSGN